MREAATAQAYERAAALRDKLQSLNWLSASLKRVRHLVEQPIRIYPLASSEGTETWYVLQGGRVRAAFPAPLNAIDRAKAAQHVQSIAREKKLHSPFVPLEEIDDVFLVAAWFRRHPEERERLIDPAAGVLKSALTLPSDPESSDP
jgi:hypothetical protein